MKNYTVEQIMEFVLKGAKAAAEDAGYSGRWDDGGASRLEEQVRFYKMGQKGEVPEVWKQFIPPPTPEEIRSANHPLQFEYCECGCHCHSASSKGIGYSIYNDLTSKKSLTVRRGHGIYGVQIGPKFSDWNEAVKAAQDDWDKIP
jgi:hypothetical protein